MFGLSHANMAWASGVVLAATTMLFIVVLLLGPRQRDPQMGQAVGCLLIILTVLIALDALLAAAIAFDWPWLVKAIFGLVVIPCGWVLAGLVFNLVRRVRRRI